jgi:hypothetical protein
MVIGNELITNPENSALAKAQRAEAIQDIQQAACVYGWPHMLGSKKSRSVSFHFSLDGQEIPEKDPSKMPGIREFVKCYEALNTQIEGVESKEILFSSGGAKKESTGTLAWMNIPSSQSDRDFAKSGLIPIASVALMRQANFIVRYMDVTQKADQISTRGVFKSNEVFDSVFRKSEPVAHDQWNPAKLQLKPNARNPIKQTLDGIKETFKGIAGAQSEMQDGSASVVLGNVVGRLLDGLALTGPTKPKPGGAGGGSAGGGGGGSKSIQVYPVGSPKIISSNQNRYVALFKFQVMFPKEQIDTTEIAFSAYAILENGNPELEPPPGVEVPKILGISIEGQLVSESETIELDPSMNLKYLEIAVAGPQGVGSTCRWKAIN